MQDDVEDQVKAMRSTLEEIYNSQLELMRSELEQSHQTSMLDIRETLGKEHKEEMNRMEQEWNVRLEQIKQDYEEQLREDRLGGSLGKIETLTGVKWGKLIGSCTISRGECERVLSASIFNSSYTTFTLISLIVFF